MKCISVDVNGEETVSSLTVLFAGLNMNTREVVRTVEVPAGAVRRHHAAVNVSLRRASVTSSCMPEDSPVWPISIPE